jgi:hypothetical protein
MKQKCTSFYLCCGITLLSGYQLAATQTPPPLTERTANSSRDPTQPQTLSDVFSSIRAVFDVALSLEGVPEESGYVDPSGGEVPPFSIRAGETFGSVMRRVVAESDDIYKFEVIRGTPILRPNPDIVETTNLLDTVINLNIEDATIWDALCDLARSVNRENLATGGKALYIHLQGPEFIELPPPPFLEEGKVLVDLNDVSAREAMCAIMESAKQPFNYYYYVWPSGFSYVSVVATDGKGRVIHGERVREVKRLDYWSDENIEKLQSAGE